MIGVTFLFERFGPFLDDAFHAHAFLAGEADVQHFTHFLQAPHVFLGFPQVRDECRFQVGIVRPFKHFRERFRQLILCGIKVLQLAFE